MLVDEINLWIPIVIALFINWYCALQNSVFFCHSPRKTISMIMPVIAPVNLLVDARKLILHYRDLLTHRCGCILSMARAAETWSYSRQMRLNEFFRFCITYFSLSEWKRTDDSTNALIQYVRVAKIALSIVTIKNLIVFCHGWGHVCHTSWDGMIILP